MINFYGLILGIIFILISLVAIIYYKTKREIPPPEGHNPIQKTTIDYGRLIGGVCLIIAGFFIIYNFIFMT